MHRMEKKIENNEKQTMIIFCKPKLCITYVLWHITAQWQKLYENQVLCFLIIYIFEHIHLFILICLPPVPVVKYRQYQCEFELRLFERFHLTSFSHI